MPGDAHHAARPARRGGPRLRRPGRRGVRGRGHRSVTSPVPGRRARCRPTPRRLRPPEPIAADGVLGAPDLRDDPDPDAVPADGRIDVSSLLDPPTLQPPPDRSRPFDPEAGIFNLDHLIFIVQENRSFDHYFGTFPGADGLPRATRTVSSTCAAGSRRRACATGPTTTRTSSMAAARTARRGSHRRSSTAGRMDGFIEALGDRQRLHASRTTPTARVLGRRPGRRGSPTSWATTPSRRSRTTGSTRETLRAARPDVRADRFLDPAGAPVPGLGVVGDLHGPRTTR